MKRFQKYWQFQALTQPRGESARGIGTSTYMNSDVGVEFMNQLIGSSGKNGCAGAGALMNTQRWACNKSGIVLSGHRVDRTLFGDPAMPIMIKNKDGPTTPRQVSRGKF